MRLRSTAAAFAATALVATSCGGAVSGPLAENVGDTMLESLKNSLRINVSLDAAFDLVELNALVEAFPEFEGEPEDDEGMAQALALMDALSLEMAKSDDLATSSFALLVEDKPAFELRQDSGAFAGMTSLAEMLEAEPADVTAIVRVDEAAIRRISDLADEPIVDERSFSEMLAESLSEDPFGVPDDLRAVLEAGAAGEWAGLSGVFDLSGFYDELGMTPEMLAMMVPSDMQIPTREDVAQVIADSVTFTRGDDVDGQAVYTADVDSDTFLRGAADLYGRMDATGMMAGMLDDMFGDLDLPLIPNAMTVTFDGDNFTSMTINGAAIAAEVVISQYDASEERNAEFRQAIADLENTRLNVVMTFSDHGQVGNLLSGIDAVTVDWQVLLDLASEFATGAGFATGGGFEDSSAMFEGETAEDAEAQSLLRNAAIAQETHFTDNGTYTTDVTALEAAGLPLPVDKLYEFEVVRGDESSYCMQASIEGGQTWSFDIEIGFPIPGPCF